jgi:CheY-like chemotaxis protein
MHALKFSPPGKKVKVTTKMKSEAGKCWLCLSVQDEGPGIAAEEAALLFDKFRQGQRGRASGEGVGLGLAIAKKFVEFHGGRIEVDGGLGTGANFTVFIPGARQAQAQFPQAVLRNGPVLLLVEDDVDIRDYFAEGLRGHGYEVVVAANGKEGYQEFLRSKPDIVLTDIKMTEVDGLELLVMIRNHSATLPVVLFTGVYPGLADDLGSLPVKADHVISKPATVDEVAVILRSMVPDQREAS